MCSKRRRVDSQKHPAFWESMVSKYEGRNCELEEKECELQNRLELLEKTTAPHRMLFNMWRLMQNEPLKHQEFTCYSSRRSRSRERNYCKGDSRERSRSPLQSTSPPPGEKKYKNTSNSESKMILQQYIRTLEEEKGQLTRQKHYMENLIKDLEMQLHETKANQSPHYNNDEDNVSIGSMEFELMKSVQELKERGLEMSKRIEVMEKRESTYLETLKQADEICAEMEIGYKQHCFKAEQNEAEMRDRLQRLKRREESERRCCYGDSIHQGRDKKSLKQDHRDAQKNNWSMFNPISSMLNRWH